MARRKAPLKLNHGEYLEVRVWEERDRLHICVYAMPSDREVASWWDDDARQMFEDGTFKSGRGMERSITDYVRQTGMVEESSGVRANGVPEYVDGRRHFTDKQIGAASSEALDHRLFALNAEAHRKNGLTRALWNEFHAIHAERRRRYEASVKGNPGREAVEVYAEKLMPSGAWALSAIVGGRRHTGSFYGYTKRDAIALFRKELREEGLTPERKKG